MFLAENAEQYVSDEYCIAFFLSVDSYWIVSRIFDLQDTWFFTSSNLQCIFLRWLNLADIVAFADIQDL